MQDVTSFETTKKLLEAGFPASEDWGIQYWIESLLSAKGTIQTNIGDEFLGNGSSRTIRASSTLDILKQLPVGYVIGFDPVGECWMCYLTDSGPVEVCFSKNSAEATAEMYLKVNS